MSDKRTELGLVYAVAAYSLWGMIPIYFKAVKQVPPVELLAHRAIWSFLVLAILVASLKRWPEIADELRSRKLRCMLLLSTLCIGVNWLTFIYAVSSGQILQSSLGYFVTPLVSVFLGVVVLRERLRSFQVVSIVLAMAGMLLLAMRAGQLPWIAVTLALSFGAYGLLRKLMSVDGLISLTVETFFMLPIAVVYLACERVAGKGASLSPALVVLLMLAGPVTTAPLLFFGAAARRLRLSTLGIVQYLTPTFTFLLAVFAYREPFSAVQTVSFAAIWSAIAIYTADSLWVARQNRLALVEPFGGEEPSE